MQVGEKWWMMLVTFLHISVLILSRLTLRHSSTWPVCSWAAASSAHKLEICLGDRQKTRPPYSHQKPWLLKRVNMVILPHKCLGSSYIPGGFHFLPSRSRCQAPFSFIRIGTHCWKLVNVRIFKLSILRLESDYPRSDHKEGYSPIPKEEGFIAK